MVSEIFYIIYVLTNTAVSLKGDFQPDGGEKKLTTIIIALSTKNNNTINLHVCVYVPLFDHYNKQLANARKLYKTNQKS